MLQKDNTILLNLNQFGPSFADSDKKWLISKPKKEDVNDQKKNW